MAKKKINDEPILKTGSRQATEYEDLATFMRAVRDLFQKDLDADRHNIEPARQDIQFVIGDQWDIDTKIRRERLRKPVLTVNRLPAFVAQYVGAWLQSDTSIKLIPTRGGSRKVAEIRQGLIRTITRNREAKRALHKAMENAYICGVGNFSVSLVDAKNDVFLRDVVIQAIGDPFAVTWDRASYEPTGADANHCFVTRYMTKDDFKRAYPKADDDSGWAADELDASVMVGHGFEVDEMLRVCEFWQMREEPITLGLEADSGDVIDVTEMADAERAMLLAVGDDGQLVIRETVKPYAECYVLTSKQVLEGPYRLDIPRLPVFRVEGWSLQEAAVRYRWGFVRNAKDPQRLHNYWRSILAEELMKSPASKWLLDQAGIKVGMDDQFRNAHLSGDPVLKWDSAAGGSKPEFIPPPMLNQAVLTEAQMTVQDIRDVTNRHEASMGQVSNEVSGKAITARQRVSELGDVIYIENMNAALAEAGRVINDLIPIVYDTNRVVKITGDDDIELVQEINGRFGDETPDITTGKYDVSYTTGPSYATKRQEAVDVMMTLMNTMPQVGNVVADIIVRNMDIPGAEEIEERLASMMPPGMINPERLTASRRERVAKQAEQQAAAQEQQAQLQQVMVQLQIEEAKAKIAELQSRTVKQMAQAELAQSQVGVDAFEAEIKQDKVEVDAAKVGAEVDRMGVEVFRMGLENAQNVRANAQEAQKNGKDGKTSS